MQFAKKKRKKPKAVAMDGVTKYKEKELLSR
jgi:hypothetical protein